MDTECSNDTAPGITIKVCSDCLESMCMHDGGNACEGASFEPHTFATAEEMRTKRAEAKTRSLNKRAYEACHVVINVNDRADNFGTYSARCNATLRAMRDVAQLLGGETLTSFVRCVETLARLKATLHTDSCPLSLGFKGGGMLGGFIFHSSDRTWSLHT